jgi:predicted metal-binding protein
VVLAIEWFYFLKFLTKIYAIRNLTTGEGMEKYIQLAKELNMVNALIISPQEISFDIRALLKCRWGCEYGLYSLHENIKCHSRDTTYQERVEMVKRTNHILLLHSHDAKELSEAVLEIERTAFLDGYYFAFAIRSCNLCEVCAVRKRNPCPTPGKIRPRFNFWYRCLQNSEAGVCHAKSFERKGNPKSLWFRIN